MIDRTQIQQIALLALAAGALFLCWMLVQPFLGPMVAASALAILFYPAHAYLLRKLGHRENLTATVSLLAIILLILLPAIWVVWTISLEASHLFQEVRNKSALNGGWVEWLISGIDGPLRKMGIDPTEVEGQIRGYLADRVQALSGAVLAVARGVVTNLFGFLFDAVVALFVLFFLLRDGHRLLMQAREFLPLQGAVYDRLIRDVGQSVLANVYGIGAVAMLQGIGTGLLFWAVGLPSPVLWGAVAGFLSMIPILGPPVVWIPAAIGLAMTGHWVKALIVGVAGGLLVGSLDNVVRPWVISGRVQLHPLLVFISLLGGASAFGLLGLFIGPAVLSVTIVVFEALKWGMPGIAISDAEKVERDRLKI